MMACAERKSCARPNDLNLCICRSRRRVGRCEFSARLFSYWLVLLLGVRVLARVRPQRDVLEGAVNGVLGLLKASA